VLYRPEAFESLVDVPWNEQRARDAIREIVEDADRAFRYDELWPADEWDAWTSPVPLQSLHTGTAGVIWALDALRRRGYAETQLDLPAAAARTLAAWRATPDFPTSEDPGAVWFGACRSSSSRSALFGPRSAQTTRLDS